VADPEQLHRERPEGQPVPGLHRVEGDSLGDLRLLELDLDQPPGQGGGIDRRRDLPDQEGQGADMIFMAVGDENSPHPCLLVPQILPVWDDEVHPQHVVLREHDPGVDDQHVAAIFDGHHVFADLPQPSQGNNP
jgi:hypothetical protein